MRRHDDLGIRAERRVLGQRLHFVDIQRRARDLAGFQRGQQIDFVDDPAPRAIQEPHAVLHLRKRGGVHHAARLVRHRHVNRDEVGGREEPVQLVDQFHAQLLGAIERQVGIVGDDLHAEGERALGDFAADAAHAEHAERLAKKFSAFERLAVPLAFGHREMRLGDFSRQRHQHRERQLGGRNGVAVRRVHHDDAALGGGIDIHVVHADARAADHFEVGGGFHHLAVDLGLGANRERGGVLHQEEQFSFTRGLGQHQNFERGAGFKQLNALWRNGVADDDLHKRAANVGEGRGQVKRGNKLFFERAPAPSNPRFATEFPGKPGLAGRRVPLRKAPAPRRFVPA